MLRVTYYPAFLLVAAVVSAHVEPPTNVTFRCHNMRNMLKWSYSEMVPGLKFRVDIVSYYREDESLTKPKVVEPPTLQVDLSNLSNPNRPITYFPNEYTVSVSAIVGSNESHATPQNGISFSYYQDSQAHHKCFLDFPPVNISAEKDHLVSIRFVHPWFFYGGRLLDKHTNKSRQKRVPEFKYSVKLLGQNTTADETCKSNSCSAKLQLHTAQETHCVKVNGEMDHMAVRGKHKYCMAQVARPNERSLSNNAVIPVAIAMATLIASLGLAFILFMVYKKKTRARTHLPKTLNFSERVKQITLGLTPEHVSRVDPSSPDLLLDRDRDGDKPESTVHTPEPADLDVRLTIGLPSEGEGAGGDEVAEEVEGPGPEYLSGRELDDEDEALSSEISSAGYEKRVNATVQLAQDETLEGYRCRSLGEHE